METTQTQELDNKNELLSKITKNDALYAKYGAVTSKLCKEYVNKYSEFKRGDKVYLETYDNKLKYGIIEYITFDTSQLFRYAIKPLGKNFTNKTNRHALYYYNTGTKRVFSEIVTIKKAIE